jgi:parallel beta-helix repeat protein
MFVLSSVKQISAVAAALVLVAFLTLAFDCRLAGAEPRTWIVDDDGPADFHTIGEAINASSSGDEIFVLNGTYYENVVVNKAVRLVGEDRIAVVIDGNGTTPLTITASNASVSGFTMRGGTQTYPTSGIYVERADYCSITNNIAKDNVYGIHLWGGADNNTVSGNIVTNNSNGIFLDGAAGNNVSGNNIAGNFVRGILLFGGGSFSNSIFGNNITSNVDGVGLDHVRDNCVWGNNIENNEVGIGGRVARCNRIYRNNITANTYGISMGVTYENTFYHNNFINNERHADLGWTWNQTWDDGYPSGGNYWNDCEGVDLYHGSYQNETGSDGIADTPYIIDADNRDNYPLMKPYPWASHDIGITSITTSKTFVGQGYNVSINTMMFNYGNDTETTNITIHANTTTIATFTNIIQESRNSTTLTFTWNTTGFAKGTYTITVVADIVPDETDVADNTYPDGSVTVTWLGDLNGDLDVDEDDVWTFCGAFMDYYKIHVKDANCDFDDNCKIDEDDLWTMCGAFINYWKQH